MGELMSTRLGAARVVRTLEPLEPLALVESERLLRQTRYILDARIIVNEETTTAEEAAEKEKEAQKSKPKPPFELLRKAASRLSNGAHAPIRTKRCADSRHPTSTSPGGAHASADHDRRLHEDPAENGHCPGRRARAKIREAAQAPGVTWR